MDLNWYLVTTKLKSEPRVKDNLVRNHEIETFFPHYPPRSNRSPVGTPLFARYVFVRCNPERDFDIVRYTPGVTRIVTFGAEVTPVPDEVVENLKSRCNGYDQIIEATIAKDNLTAGSKVRVRSGVFDGCEGIIKEKRGSKRISLLLELAYGQELKVELNTSAVERTDD